MKQYLIDLCMVNEEDVVEEMDLNQIEEFNDYIDEVFACSLDPIDFDEFDIDKRFWILEDGGEAIRLKDGRYFETCFRGNMCRVWEADNEELIALLDKYVNKALKGA